MVVVVVPSFEKQDNLAFSNVPRYTDLTSMEVDCLMAYNHVLCSNVVITCTYM